MFTMALLTMVAMALLTMVATAWLLRRNPESNPMLAAA
jgi:hypothetical protein